MSTGTRHLALFVGSWGIWSQIGVDEPMEIECAILADSWELLNKLFSQDPGNNDT